MFRTVQVPESVPHVPAIWQANRPQLRRREKMIKDDDVLLLAGTRTKVSVYVGGKRAIILSDKRRCPECGRPRGEHRWQNCLPVKVESPTKTRWNIENTSPLSSPLRPDCALPKLRRACDSTFPRPTSRMRAKSVEMLANNRGIAKN